MGDSKEIVMSGFDREWLERHNAKKQGPKKERPNDRATKARAKALLAIAATESAVRASEQIEANRANLAKGPKKARKGGGPWVIGVDPAIRNNGLGVCVIKPEGVVEFPKFKGRGIVAFTNWIYTVPKGSRAVIENSNLQNATFDNSGNSSVRARKSRNVGMNQGISVVLVEFLEDALGEWNVKQISPLKKGSKWNAERFNRGGR